MLKKLAAIAAAALLCAANSCAALELNTANAAELDSVKGIGPAFSTRVLAERKKGNYKDWPDFMQRIKGVRDARAAKLSAQGLTVNGQPFAPASPAVPAQ